MERYALIVAGGKGERFGGTLPKQFQSLGGVPLIIHTLRAFEKSLDWDELLLVLHPNAIEDWEGMKDLHFRDKEAPRVIEGGQERFHSVRNGLHALPQEGGGTVAVHDAVRPLIRPERIRSLMEAAEQEGNAIPVVPLRESIRQLDDRKGSRALDRSKLRAVQTPQCFPLGKLRAAMECDFDPSFTDEASVMEAQGEELQLCDGDPENIKITRPMDLKLAGSILKDREEEPH